MTFKRINNITGWIVCLIACTVYILTSEASGSLWDCGEFISSAFKLQVPHPPGAPLFVLLGRFFIVLFGDDASTAAKAVNVMNSLASGFTILFLFWTITHFARRIIYSDLSRQITNSQIWTIMGAGVVGALAYTFSDSFWYSAVEGEVYALSSFFTALVFWAILKWEHQADKPGSDRWIVFIFFMMGLSIGVHLLNLLTIPAIVMVYYFRKRHEFNYAVIRKYFLWGLVIFGILGFIVALAVASSESNSDRGLGVDNTLAGFVLFASAVAIGLLYFVEGLNKDKKQYYGGVYVFFVLGCVITGIVQVGVIQYSIKTAGAFDRLFVNSFGLPFFSGFVFFFVLVAAVIWWLMKYAAKRNWPYLRLALWCFTFMMIGYSSYLTTMIRSSADPAVDMYNVDNPMSLVGYLGREQYGDFPLLYGQKFTARPVDIKEGSAKWQKGHDKYIETGKDFKYVYLPEDKMIFPRMWDASNDQGHADYYADFSGIGKNQDGSYDRSPSFADNIRFFIGYQNYFMYLRYFLWNFSGKQNDNQGQHIGNVRDGNWITGIGFIDNMLYGNQSLMPDSLKNNNANNKLFALPLILGLIGLFYHFKRRGDDAFVSFLLFFFTGFAIVVYLNQAGYQPRERDYAYVGSFYAFCIWIGLGVLKVREWLSKLMNPRVAGMAATVICLGVPLLMAAQEWDDHDRSEKVLAKDLARNYLESCAPNAIVFSFGDNDTYPLWYAQEVEGIRTDVRVINASLLGIDWYINQLRYQINKSPAIDVIWNADQIEGGRRDFVANKQHPSFGEGYHNLYTVMKDWVGSDDPAKMEHSGYREPVNTMPTRKVFVPVDVSKVRANGTVDSSDNVVPRLEFEIPAHKSMLYKNDLAILNIIAANQWNRPIYFTSPSVDLGFNNYLRKDGLTYRLVPVLNERVHTDWMKDKLMNVFKYGNADKPGVYFDEENRRHLLIIRQAYTELAISLVEKNRKEEARQVLDKVDKGMLQENMPYGHASRNNMHNAYSLQFLQACYMADAKDLAAKVSKSVRKDLQQQLRFYDSLSEDKAEQMAYDRNTTETFLRQMDQMEQQMANKPQVPISPETPRTLDSNK